MSHVGKVVISAVLAFFSTTMDDFAVLLIFFSKAQVEYPTEIRKAYLKVIAGQTLGFTIVILISLIGMVLGLIIPQNYIDLIGFFPLLMGLWNAYELMDDNGCLKICNTASDDEDPSTESGEQKDSLEELQAPNPIVQAASQIRLALSRKLSSKRSADGFKRLSESLRSTTKNSTSTDVESNVLHKSGADKTVVTYGSIHGDKEDEEAEHSVIADAVKAMLSNFVDPFMLEVCVVALIFSSDNIAIYMSIFASIGPWYVFLTCAIFYALLAFNIITAILLMQVSLRSSGCCFVGHSKPCWLWLEHVDILIFDPL
jgi:cadmium resistance protein CadD (predicted permease)